MPIRFVSKPIEPVGAVGSEVSAGGEPPLPQAFRFEGEEMEVGALVRTWRSTKDDRGDTYLKRHWFEFETSEGRRVVVYFDRGARRGQPRWWLYTITIA
ncbi:MAG TPA: DUF6504 family protein [Candidatus Baltobacteraceae bacterium]|jgi:hypothetical protein|nr:DUF6504 family protein [Candidatus Baltobacteraceae bacterium]